MERAHYNMDIEIINFVLASRGAPPRPRPGKMKELYSLLGGRDLLAGLPL